MLLSSLLSPPIFQFPRGQMHISFLREKYRLRWQITYVSGCYVVVLIIFWLLFVLRLVTSISVMYSSP